MCVCVFEVSNKKVVGVELNYKNLSLINKKNLNIVITNKETDEAINIPHQPE